MSFLQSFFHSFMYLMVKSQIESVPCLSKESRSNGSKITLMVFCKNQTSHNLQIIVSFYFSQNNSPQKVCNYFFIACTSQVKSLVRFKKHTRTHSSFIPSVLLTKCSDKIRQFAYFSPRKQNPTNRKKKPKSNNYTSITSLFLYQRQKLELQVIPN